MNTNSNVYTVIYTAIIVIVVAAVLALVSQSLKGRQEANEKADTISQMLTAAGFGTKAEFGKMGNAAVIDKYSAEIEEAFTVGIDGEKKADLPEGKVFSPKELKSPQLHHQGSRKGGGSRPSRLQVQGRPHGGSHLRRRPLGPRLGIHRLR